MSGTGFILSFQPSSGSGGAGGNVDMYEAAGNPGVTNDGVDTAGIGEVFHEGDLWFNSATGILWVCLADTTGAAVWRINVVSTTGAPTANALPRFDGVTGQLIKGSILTLSDAGELSFPAAGSVNINSGAAVLSTTALTVSSAMAIGTTPSEAKALVLRNSSAASAGAQQYSPATYWAGQGWKTVAPASGEIAFRAQCEPIQGVGLHRGAFTFASSLAGAAYVDVLTLTAGGGVTLPIGNLVVGMATIDQTALSLAGALAIGTSPTEATGLVLRNSTAAALGAQQYSPSIYMAGQGWDTTPGASTEFIWRQTLIPVQGTTINGNLTWSFSRAGGAYTDVAQIDQYGVWTLPRYSYVGCGPADGSSGSVGLYHDNAMGLTDVHALAAFGTAYSLQLVSGRASGAGNISVTADAYIAAAAIDPAHKVLALSWIDNVYARHELGYFTGGGGLTLSSAMAIGATPAETKALVLRNSTAAAVGAQQYSPSIYMAGQGWSTDGAGASMETLWRITAVPAQGAAAPTTSLSFAASVNGGGYSIPLTISQSGVTVNGTVGATSTVFCEIDGGGNLGFSASAYRFASAFLSTGVNIANGANVLTSTAATISSAMAIGVTSAETKALVLRNSTAAALGAQQYSPSIYLAGQGWETTGGSSDEVVWRITNVPVQGAAASTKLVFASSLNGAAYSSKVSLGSSGSLLWETDGAGDIGASGANRPNIIYAATQVTTPTLSAVNVATTSFIWAYNDVARMATWEALGLGSHGAGVMVNSGQYASVIGSNTLTDAASAVVAATVYDRNAASITNATTMRLHSFGWTNNADAYTEVASVRADGAIYALSFNSTAATTAIITGAEADGATAIGVKLNTSTTYSTAGSKLLSVQNNGTEKAYLTFDGLFRVASSIRVAGDYGSGEASCVTFTDVVDAAGDTAAAAMNWRVNGSAGVFHGWLKIWDGTTYVSVPSFHAA